MANELAALAIEGVTKLASSFIRSAITKQPKTDEQPIINDKPITKIIESQDKNEPVTKNSTPAIPKLFNPSSSSDTDYRWECVLKHLGAAAVLFREAHERAITDKKVTDGVAEKVMAALSEHAGMDDDIKMMLTNPNAKDAATRLMDGLRQLRRAAWECRITVGGGTVEDVADARLWNDVMFQEAYTQAKKNPGEECVLSGM